MSEAFRQVAIERVGPYYRHAVMDGSATEEPLEVRLQGQAFAVIMRTPGADRDLTAGFLLAEQVIQSPLDVHAIHVGPDDQENVVDVTLRGERAAHVAALLENRRQITQTSSCGMCGRRSIDAIHAAAPTFASTWTIPGALLTALPARLRDSQVVFEETGGLHAAGLFDREGTLAAMAEDVGRHNAVDKVVGRMLMAGRLPLDDFVLFVSGRTSFEIVQKAFLAGIPVVAAVSAPSTLAIELAEEAGITLAGFVRGETFNVYTHGHRIARRT